MSLPRKCFKDKVVAMSTCNGGYEVLIIDKYGRTIYTSNYIGDRHKADCKFSCVCSDVKNGKYDD